MFAGDVSATAPVIDPVPVVLDAEAWSQLSAGLIQRMRLLDALYADLYGPRTVLAAEVAPVAQLLQDPGYLRAAVGIPARGNHHLFAVTSTVTRTAEGSWVVLEDAVDVPDGAGTTLELRRVLSRCAPTLYRSTPLRRLHPFFDALRTSLHQRTRAEGRAGRTVVLTKDAEDPLRAFDHSWLANLLGAPVVSAGDLRTGSGTLTLRLPGLDSAAGDAVDALLRLVPSGLVDPLDLGPTPLRGVTGLVEAARCGDVEIFNPIGAGLLENPDLRTALPDLCRQLLHEDLLLRPAGPDTAEGGWLGLDPAGGDALVERPVRLRLLVMRTEDGFDVLPGGIGLTADDGPAALKDVWVTVPETAAVPARSAAQADAAALDSATPRDVLTTYPAMTRSIGSDLFWFGRYLERVDATARLLRTVLDTVNDLDAEPSPSARTAQSVLLGAVTEVTTTYPGFPALDLRDRETVRTEIESLLTDRSRPGALAQSYAALAHTTRTLRDLISDDVWPVIARMNQRLRSLGGQDAPPLEQGLTEIVDGCLTLSGAVADSMPRNLGWDLMEVGRKIERTSSLLALLRALLGRRRTSRGRGADRRCGRADHRIRRLLPPLLPRRGPARAAHGASAERHHPAPLDRLPAGPARADPRPPPGGRAHPRAARAADRAALPAQQLAAADDAPPARHRCRGRCRCWCWCPRRRRPRGADRAARGGRRGSRDPAGARHRTREPLLPPLGIRLAMGDRRCLRMRRPRPRDPRRGAP